jgi:hypothetical protein
MEQNSSSQYPRALIVEDEPMIALGLEAHLRELGFQACDLATDADQALSHAMRNPPSAPAQHTYSKAVQKACAKDYKRHCGQYGVETEALRLCMDRAGQRLTKPCVDALVAAGEVSKQEVERRNRSGR